jgi:hypothetical protein
MRNKGRSLSEDASVLTLNQLAMTPIELIPSLDLAAVDLSCASGLPGSENVDVSKCLKWIDHAAAWTRHTTDQTLERFRQEPGKFDHSEALFRMLAMFGVLQKGLKVRYDPDRISDPDGRGYDSRTTFIHGAILGPGGTCSSLPVLIVAVGRRLGYPLKLVPAFRHLFVRWDDPAGERINFDWNNDGLDSHDDEHYMIWPVPIRGTPLHRDHYLVSMTPYEEVAEAWTKRGYCLLANKNYRNAAKAFAVALSLAPHIAGADQRLERALVYWQANVLIEFASRENIPRIRSPQRIYPGIPESRERELIEQDVIHEFLLGSTVPSPASSREWLIQTIKN